MTRAALGLGSNQGDRLATLRTAVQSLARHPDVSVVGVSALYETDPVGGPEQDDYLNAVVVVDTPLSPHDLLRLSHMLEDDAKRVRDVRWGPRTLDIDVLAMDDITLDDDVITLPHPRAHERSFVLVPWAEVEPDAVLGESTVTQWLAARSGVGVRLFAREWTQS